MQDRKAPHSRPLIQGISREEFNEHRADAGTTWAEVRGLIPRNQGISETNGAIPSGPGFIGPVRAVCLGITKSGNDCKARPVGGKEFCIGHLRQLGDFLEDDEG